jgi:hypothetical protein
MQYYSAVERNEFLAHAAIWMNLESIMLCEKKSDTKGQIPQFHLHEVSRKAIYRETESRLEVIRD